MVGQPIGVFRTYLFDGIYQADEQVLPGSGSRTGGVKVRDVNGDGQITTDDQVITGNANPNFIFVFSTNLAYKGFDLAAFVTGVQGNEVFNLTRYLFENPLGARNVLAGMADRWSPTNPNTNTSAVSRVEGCPFRTGSWKMAPLSAAQRHPWVYPAAAQRDLPGPGVRKRQPPDYLHGLHRLRPGSEHFRRQQRTGWH
jgi:hypothetical protein